MNACSVIYGVYFHIISGEIKAMNPVSFFEGETLEVIIQLSNPGSGHGNYLRLRPPSTLTVRNHLD